MKKLKYWQAINQALKEEMIRDERIVLIGEDVSPGGAWGVTRGLEKEFGSLRVRDMPISEQAIVGAGVGAALAGLCPVVELLVMDFVMLAMDPLVNHAAKYRYLSDGKVNIPLVLRTGAGAGDGMGAQHTQSLEAWFAHVPGLKVVWPATPNDAGALLKAAIRDPDPVLFLESISQYREMGEVSEPIEPVPIGQARMVAKGKDATVITYGTATRTCLDAVQILADQGLTIELLDLRSLAPWDVSAAERSVRRTGRCVVVHDAVVFGGFGAEIASEMSRRCFYQLLAPVTRLGAPRGHGPQIVTYERMRLPTALQVADAVAKLCSMKPTDTVPTA